MDTGETPHTGVSFIMKIGKNIPLPFVRKHPEMDTPF